ncbi:MAG: TonB-dependent receptor [Candidatus Eremiobacteraeota bacterium]|nr:TonB-dependent receptor [Candidatus Eremiobacteraeota bacterium]
MNRLLDGRSLLTRAVATLTILGIMFSLPSAPAFAAGGQYGNLTGSISDATTKAPIAGAQVSAVSASGRYSATTDGSGRFSIIQMVVDTYTITVVAKGYETLSLPGQTLAGDQTTDIGPWLLNRATPKTIAHVAARGSGGAFQPSATIDSYTVTPAQQLQTTGKAFSTNENNLLLAVPGVTMTNAGNPTIRGGAAYEVGYQYDGVTFKEPFLGNNGSMGPGGNLFSGIAQVQVVAGAGDATQGNVGSGVINLIPERGSGPGTLNADIEVGGPAFNHQLGATYSWASTNGQFSDFASFLGQRYTPYNGYVNTPQNQYLNYFALQYALTNQFTNNFVFKFGHNQNQSLQVLYTNIMQNGYTTGGNGAQYCNPAVPNTPSGGPCPGGTSASGNTLAYYPYDTATNFLLKAINGFNQTQYQNLAWLTPGVPSTNQAVPGNQLVNTTNTRYLKFEYDYHINPSTFFDVKYYNWETLATSDVSYSLGPWGSGFPGLAQIWNNVGGPTTGITTDVTKQFTSNFIVTANFKYDVLHPIWDGQAPGYEMLAVAGCCSALPAQPSGQDWIKTSSSTGYLCAYITCTANAAGEPRIPAWGIGYQKTFFQNWGAGLRFQYSPTDRVHLDIGAREEGQNMHWQNQLMGFGQSVGGGYYVGNCAAYNGTLAGAQKCPYVNQINPFDVPLNIWNTKFLYPHVLEPRTSIDWEMNRNDSLRFSFGASTVFTDAQTGGTPFNLTGLKPYLNIPAKPGSLCGWTATAVFPCKTYAQQLYWQGDNLEAPDAGNTQPANYRNFDLSWNHQFKNGMGLRITPFSKIGTNLPSLYILNPVLGIFATNNLGQNKTAGLETQITTPSKELGLSGFFSLTYQNVLSTTPPFTFAETTVPIVSNATIALGNLYRAGYVSPLSARIGATEKLPNGWEIIPQIQFDEGYPYTQGNTIAGQVGVNAAGNPIYANVPQVNFGPGVSSGNTTLIGTNPGTSTSTNFYDPAWPGLTGHPNIDATRGTPGTSANGGYLSHGNIYGSTTVQWTHGNSTIGIQMQNLFGNGYVNSVPAVNPWYQAVANGVSGPQTGFNTCASSGGPGAGFRGCYPNIPRDTYAYTNGAYLLTNGNFTGGPALAPLVPFNIDVFYQVKI